jgi:hypothetical protein
MLPPPDQLDQPRPHLQPHVVAFASTLAHDPPDLAPPLGGAGLADVAEPMRKCKAAVMPLVAATSRRPWSDIRTCRKNISSFRKREAYRYVWIVPAAAVEARRREPYSLHAVSGGVPIARLSAPVTSNAEAACGSQFLFCHNGTEQSPATKSRLYGVPGIGRRMSKDVVTSKREL